VSNIRNFCIIAHIDHGKSTLADRLIERTHGIDQRQMRDLVMDSMDLERERGITIKSKAIRLEYEKSTSEKYILNLVDTPGHVDFSYEVSRGLEAVEGAILLVDATQGIEAQTLANLYLARRHNHVIIPVINKIDLSTADPDKVEIEMLELLNEQDHWRSSDGATKDTLRISARQGTGIDEVLNAIVTRVPPPSGNPQAPLRALIFDSIRDPYRGVIIYIRIVDGELKQGQKTKLHKSGCTFDVAEVGHFRLDRVPCESLKTGDIGYVVTGIKELENIKIGDTLTDVRDKTTEPLPGFREPKPFVFCGIYPVANEDYAELKKAIETLRLSDASFVSEQEESPQLGGGFRMGFLGLLHRDIIGERVSREFNVEVIMTAPNVEYRVMTTGGEWLTIDNPADLPESSNIKKILEPYVEATVITPPQFMSPIIEFLKDRRGVYVEVMYLHEDRVVIRYELPLAEILTDFYDRLKSISHGYASFDYRHLEPRESDLTKVEILVNNEPVDALSWIVHTTRVQIYANWLTRRLKEVIPRHQFPVPIQARVGKRIIARETVPAYRKDVTAPLYGGDVTRKKKLLEKQKRGKKKMKQLGKISLPQQVFLTVMKID